MTIRKIGRLAACVALAMMSFGCTTVYQGPPGDSRASLTIVNGSVIPMNVETYEDADGCRHRSMLPRAIAPRGRLTIDIAGDRDVAMTLYGDAVGGMSGGSLCRPVVIFSPGEGRRYVLVYKTEVGGCRVGIFDGDLGNLAEAAKVPFEMREWKTPWGEAGPFCPKKGKRVDDAPADPRPGAAPVA